MNAAWFPSGGGGVKNVFIATPVRPLNVHPRVGSKGSYVKLEVTGCSNEGFKIVAAEAPGRIARQQRINAAEWCVIFEFPPLVWPDSSTCEFLTLVSVEPPALGSITPSASVRAH